MSLGRQPSHRRAVWVLSSEHNRAFALVMKIPGPGIHIDTAWVTYVKYRWPGARAFVFCVISGWSNGPNGPKIHHDWGSYRLFFLFFVIQIQEDWTSPNLPGPIFLKVQPIEIRTDTAPAGGPPILPALTGGCYIDMSRQSHDAEGRLGWRVKKQAVHHPKIQKCHEMSPFHCSWLIGFHRFP